MPVPAVSVIIPVFNTGPWLRRCLDSVCGQSLHNIEIICVNDGSSDESGTILEEYAARDPRVLTITLGRNQGVGIARNIGLTAAHGEWLGFVDSDDSVAPDFYEKLYAASNESDAEIIKGNCWAQVNFPNCINYASNMEVQADKFKFRDYWVTAIYNRDFIVEHNIRLPHLTNSQDLVFLYHALTEARKVSVVNDALYYYFYRKGSSSKSLFTKKRIDDIISARIAMRDILNANYSLDASTYISEYSKMVYYLYNFFYMGAEIEDKEYALNAIANVILDFYKKCREPERLLLNVKKYDNYFAFLIANHDIESLPKFLSGDRLQRLRSNARARLAKKS